MGYENWLHNFNFNQIHGKKQKIDIYKDPDTSS